MALEPERAAELVRRAAAGEAAAWTGLVDAYGALVWSIARQYRLSSSDAADMSQTTWLRLLEHIGRLSDPAHVGAWLATTARREAMRIHAAAKRTTPVGDEKEFDRSDVVPELDLGLLRHERSVALDAALQVLPPRCRRLLRLLTADPPISYATISAELTMPVGSIGPTRARCLARLRAALESAGIRGDATTSP